MHPQSEAEYLKLLTEIIQKQIQVLGPDLTFAKVRKLKAIKTSSMGEVVLMKGEPAVLVQSLINEFLEITPFITIKTIQPILETYPDIAAQIHLVPPVAPAPVISSQPR